MVPNRRLRSAWPLIEVSLLRTMSGQTWEQVATEVGAPLSSCQRFLGLHRRLMDRDPDYARRAAEIATRALRACYSTSTDRRESG